MWSYKYKPHSCRMNNKPCSWPSAVPWHYPNTPIVLLSVDSSCATFHLNSQIQTSTGKRTVAVCTVNLLLDLGQWPKDLLDNIFGHRSNYQTKFSSIHLDLLLDLDYYSDLLYDHFFWGIHVPGFTFRPRQLLWPWDYCYDLVDSI